MTELLIELSIQMRDCQTAHDCRRLVEQFIQNVSEDEAGENL